MHLRRIVVIQFVIATHMRNLGFAEATPNKKSIDVNDEFERRLAAKAIATFAHWTPEKVVDAVPLELKLDDNEEESQQRSNHPRRKKHESHLRMTNQKEKRKRRNHEKRNNISQILTRSFSIETQTDGNINGSKGYDNKQKYNERSHGQDSSTAPLLSEVVEDSDWPYNGAIQSATGRILFRFSSDQVFKCSGTVIQDDTTARSIVLTAAHCAYDDMLKEFASMAVFIPDQDGTLGSTSDFDCSNDVYGCWLLSFAVIERGWSSGSFPNNVGYDYAYYVVHDRSSTHLGGYSENVTGILDEDVTPMQIDFDLKLQNDFAVALGYSDEYDPSFQYCSNKLSNMNGIDDYTNLWLSNCRMSGGASGGPWTASMDESGVGKVVSINSWGYKSNSGVAGPVLRTKSGSFAECLFEKAKTAPDPGDVGGYVVDC
ncbi:hypothetical protein HJC23_002999 [Cyclotella cryptica]|uniref:Peptidase S1 domain-containing protein n=1 Tax=Cyclotella cryptica TaxID=29204 RepID=A0ABD3PY04_9STRA